MAFCDHCSCLDCRTGVAHLSDVNGNPVPDMMTMVLTHAPTEWDDWICDVCYAYECCVD